MKRRTFLIKSATVLAGASFAPATVVVGNGCRAAPSIKGRQRSPATEPLRVHPTNPRYFTDGSGRAIYLTGSHTWTNLQEGDASKPPFDFDAYLDFLVQHNHNFVRLWSWQSTGAWIFPAITPHPWERTGPGKAQDGKPKFDLTKFHQPYFNRLRSRVMAARDRSIYVGVMLFVGGTSPSPTNGDGIPSTLDNVLFEVINEGGTKEWDWFIVRLIHHYEKTKPKQHPVGLTGHGGETNDSMLASPADWFSPGAREWPDLRANPRAADGKKVSLLDTDHIWGEGGNHRWVWKSFLRGYNPIYMDRLATLTGDVRGDIPGAEEVRKAMGHTRTMANRINLAEMIPRSELASTAYCLAQPGVEYLVYLPEGGEVTVDLSQGKGTFVVEWMHPVEGTLTPGGMTSGGAQRTLTAPGKGDWVLHLTTHAR